MVLGSYLITLEQMTNFCEGLNTIYKAAFLSCDTLGKTSNYSDIYSRNFS